MSLRSGLASQFSWGEESTWGTAVTMDKFLPYVSESMEATKERIEADSIYANRRVRDSEQWDSAEVVAGGTIELDVFSTSMGELWKHAMGGSATTGSGPYTHTFTPGDLDAKGLTVQIGKVDRAGSVQAWNFVGSKVKGWEFSVAAKEAAKLSLEFSSKDLDKDGTPALGTWVPPTALARMTWAHCTVQTLHAQSPKIKSVKIKGENGIEDDRYFLGATTIEEQDEIELRTYTAELEVEFASVALFDIFWNGTEGDLVLTLARGANTLNFTGNCRLDGGNPEQNGRGKLTQKIDATFIGDGTDADALTIVAINTDSTL